MANPFISSVDLAAYTVNDSLNSDLAAIALDAACEAVRGYVDQGLETGTVTGGWLNGSGSKLLVLPVFPATCSAVSVYSDRSDTAPDVLVLNTDYVVDESRGVLERIDGGVFVKGRQNIEVTYAYGTDTVPSDARLVALQVAARIYVVGIVQSESTGGVSATYLEGGGTLNADERHALRRYRSGV